MIKKIFALLFLAYAQASALEISVVPQARSYPTSGTIELQSRHEILIWDRREEAKWKFGFLQPRAVVGAQGLMEAGLNFYPISILELGAAYSLTSRFYKVKPFDCDANVCGGQVRRHRYTARLALAHQLASFNLIGLLTFHRIRLSHSDNSKPLVDESEVLLAMPGSDAVESSSVMLAGEREGRMLGFYAKKARMMEADLQSESQYLIYRQKMDGISMAAGVGRYASDFHNPGLSILASVAWTWGESLSLF